MVPTLALNGIFSSPFSTKSLGLCSLAGRAVTLVAVLTVKLMAVLTVCSKGVTGSNRVGIDQCILSASNKSQVSDVNTVSVLADMVHDHAGFNVSVSEKVSKSMRPTVKPTKIEATVTITIKRILPQMTAIFFTPFRVKSFQFLLSNHLAHSIPYCSCKCKGDYCG